MCMAALCKRYWSDLCLRYAGCTGPTRIQPDQLLQRHVELPVTPPIGIPRALTMRNQHRGSTVNTVDEPLVFCSCKTKPDAVTRANPIHAAGALALRDQCMLMMRVAE